MITITCRMTLKSFWVEPKPLPDAAPFEHAAAASATPMSFIAAFIWSHAPAGRC